MEDNGSGQDGTAPGGGAADLLGAAAPAGSAADGSTDGAKDGAAAGGDVGGQDGGATGGVDPDWYGNLSADAEGENASNRDWIKAKGFKDVDGLAKAYRAAEKAIHDDGRIKIPGDNAAPEEVAAFRKALGVPDDVKGYEFKAPVGEDGQPIELNSGTLGRIAEFAHKHGLPKGPMEALVADYVQGELDDLASTQRDQDAAAADWVKNQGAAADGKIAAINRAAAALGLTGAEMQGLRAAWGPEKALTVMAKLGEGMGEDVMVSGGKGKFGVSGAEARTELASLKADAEWVAKAMKPGTPENARYNRLNDAIGDAANREAQNA